MLWKARERFARFLGGEPNRLALATNVSVAINMVATGLTLPTPGEILLTDHEYGAMHWCWERAAIRQGLTLRTFPLPVTAADSRRNHRGLRTRVHAEYPAAVLQPHPVAHRPGTSGARIVAEARKRGILTVVEARTPQR